MAGGRQAANGALTGTERVSYNALVDWPRRHSTPHGTWGLGASGGAALPTLSERPSFAAAGATHTSRVRPSTFLQPLHLPPSPSLLPPPPFSVSSLCPLASSLASQAALSPKLSISRRNHFPFTAPPHLLSSPPQASRPHSPSLPLSILPIQPLLCRPPAQQTTRQARPGASPQ
ncbi:hypothetical protein E2C01_016990 [Portunus trituberculatus]|uniref:Uncharacterized protein n=1 Tax=Portunus trituberculatus TaxID=210409 RepID=A0A5B7DSE7_PORTR|nr:hypothetical protein [Portunus trituberculatus]